MVEPLSRRQIEFAMKLLRAALAYNPEDGIDSALDTEQDDVLVWESEGGSTYK